MKIRLYNKELLITIGRFAMLIGSILSIIALFYSKFIINIFIQKHYIFIIYINF